MKLIIAALVVSALPAGAWRSDPIGVYAVIDKVVQEPAEGEAGRVAVWGIFATSLDKYGDRYTAPAYGYMYFELAKGKEEICRREWADLKTVAGSGRCVGFGSRREPTGRVRMADEKAGTPEAWPVAMGVMKVEGSRGGMAPLVRSVPIPVAPAPGAEVAPGRVTLVVRNIPETTLQGVRYAFEIQGAGGEKESSGPLEPGEKETRWTPKMEVKAGLKHAWKAWITSASLTGSPGASSFTGKAGK